MRKREESTVAESTGTTVEENVDEQVEEGADEHVSEYTTESAPEDAGRRPAARPVVTGNALGTGRRKEAIARALTLVDPENRATLKRAGFLTRDARVKERKKYGLKKARKAPQYSKR